MVLASDKLSSFTETLDKHALQIKREQITTLQINIGKRCNQACHHCHVESGPNHTDNMQKATVDRLIELLAKSPDIHTVDITGGAPELNPYFREFVVAIRQMGKQVIDRCNLTILFEPGQETTAQFLAEQGIQVTASLPCYSSANVDKQRGKGVFELSIEGLQQLNALGYGKPGTGLALNLVYNPIGASLPPAQQQLERDYKKQLFDQFGIQFNQLFTITNMPIKRFAHQLQRENNWQDYMQLLLDNFNPDAAAGLMCKSLISIAFNGDIFDCDFNQMLDIPQNNAPLTIWDIQHFDDVSEHIALADHCYACTAGAGSSCGGSLV